MRIEVTEKDIYNGGRKNGYACPVALAIRRTTEIHVYVGPSYVRALGQSWTLPSNVTAFVTEFDNGRRRGAITPFSFEIPDDIIEKWEDAS